MVKKKTGIKLLKIESVKLLAPAKNFYSKDGLFLAL